MGPKVVVVTSAVIEGTDPQTLTMLAVSSAGAWQVTTPRLERTFTGSGDLTTAVFLAQYLASGGDTPVALGRTADVVYSVLKQTTDSGSSELALVAAQEQIVSPEYHFEVCRVR